VLTKSLVAARADARDVVIQTQMKRDVDAEQTNMAVGNDNVRNDNVRSLIYLSAAFYTVDTGRTAVRPVPTV